MTGRRSRAVQNQHRTLPGQLFGVAALSASCMPILLAGGIPITQSFIIWSVWLLGFATTTMTVRSVLAAQKRKPRKQHWTLISLITLMVIACSAMHVVWPAMVLPMLMISWVLMFKPPPAKHLKRVGWALVVGTIGTAGLVVRYLS